MLDDHLQTLVDHLAERLGRSVIVDDVGLRPLAVSAQLGQVDQSRIDAILQRRTDARIRAVIRAARVDRATGPVRIPAKEHLQTLGRCVFPLRVEGRHLGYLWLIDEPRLGPTELQQAAAAAGEAARVLQRRAADESARADHLRRLLDTLLTGDPAVTATAAVELEEAGVPDGGPPFTVALVRTRPPAPSSNQGENPTVDPPAMGSLAHDLRRRFGETHAVVSTSGAELVVLGSANGRLTPAGALAPPPRGLAVGLRCGLPSLQGVRNGVADARFAAEIAGISDRFGGQADWDALGSYSALQHLPRTAHTIRRLSPGLARLTAAGQEAHLETLRLFLDLAGNAQQTAQALFVHRSTVYWRLSSIERVTGIDLSDGETRLGLQLALALSDLLPESPGDAS